VDEPGCVTLLEIIKNENIYKNCIPDYCINGFIMLLQDDGDRLNGCGTFLEIVGPFSCHATCHADPLSEFICSKKNVFFKRQSLKYSYPPPQRPFFYVGGIFFQVVFFN
jgi:hypothetical protein